MSMGGVIVEQFAIEKKENRVTYLIKDTSISFYLLIPNSNSKVSMVLKIMENVNNESVKQVDEYLDKVIVIPVLNEGIINYLKSNSGEYSQADNYFSLLINMAYKILVHNHLNVDSVVGLNNDLAFNGFNNYFVSKFQGRVALVDLPNKVEVKDAIGSISSQGVENVIPDIPGEKIDVKQKKLKKDNNKEPGFVSYVLLGVMIAILSLVFLYMLL